jgi:hypothetical protein
MGCFVPWVVPFVCLVTKEVGENKIIERFMAFWNAIMFANELTSLCSVCLSFGRAQNNYLLALLEKMEVLNLEAWCGSKLVIYLFIYFNKIGMVRVLVGIGIYSVLWGVYFKIEMLRINVSKLDA